MDKNETFIKYVENKVTPDSVATTYNNMKKLVKLPKGMQNFIIDKNSKPQDYMGFVVEPYSFFLNYEINEAMVKGILPDNYQLEPISMFETGEKRYSAIIGCFNIHTTVFWGTRYELYVIAKNKDTNLVSWIICDYQSNTFNFDPKNGFKSPTLENSVFTTSFDGKIICEASSLSGDMEMDLTANIINYNEQPLNQKLWIEGNLSVDYAGKLGNDNKAPFGLIFDPREMHHVQKIDIEDVVINKMEFSFIDQSMKPFEACCFPFAQHYLTTVFPKGHQMRNADDLEAKIIEIIK